LQPFVIQCTTCKARLKVSDPSLVGDILACPKCDSMVQVVPPAGWSAASVAVAAPAAKLEPVKPTSVAPTAADASDAALALPLETPAGQGSAFDAADIPAFLEPPPLAPQIGVQPKPAASAAVASQSSLLTKLVDNWPLVACGFAVGIVVGLGGYIVATMNRNSAGELSAAAIQPAAVSDAVVPVEHTAAKPVEAEKVDSATTADEAPTIEPDGHALANEESPVHDDSADNNSTNSDSADGVSARDASPDPIEGQAVPDPVAEKVVEEDADDSGGPAERSAANVADNDATAADLAEVANAGADTTKAPPQPSTVKPDTAARPVGPPPAEAPPLRLLSHTQIKQQLSQKLPAVEFEGKVPLEQFTRFIAELSGVPIELDPTALAAVKTAGTPTVSVKLENASIAKVLQTAVSQHGLTCVLLEDKVVIRKK
jgi:hypothetical protein